MNRTLRAIAREIAINWTKPYFTARRVKKELKEMVK